MKSETAAATPWLRAALSSVSDSKVQLTTLILRREALSWSQKDDDKRMKVATSMIQMMRKGCSLCMKMVNGSTRLIFKILRTMRMTMMMRMILAMSMMMMVMMKKRIPVYDNGWWVDKIYATFSPSWTMKALWPQNVHVYNDDDLNICMHIAHWALHSVYIVHKEISSH